MTAPDQRDAAALGRPLLLALFGLTALRLLVAAAVPLSPDEAYYWIWSRAPAAGFLDHPPMVALWIRAGTLLAGESAFGIRLLGPVSALVGSFLLARAAEDLLPGRHAGRIAAILLNATLVLGIGSVTMTPDTPLIFFWTLTLFAVARAMRTQQGPWWLLAGGAAGAGLASKYTGFLLLGGIGLWLLLLPGARVWLRRPWPWAGLLLAFLVFSPVLLWNADHGWVSFIKQGGRTGAWQPGRAAGFLLELVGGQFGLATPLVFVLCAWGAWQVGMRAWRARDESETPTRDACALLAALTWLPALVFLQHALGDRVQGNWPAVLYPAGAIAAAALPNRLWRPAAILGFALTALVYVQAATSVFDLPRQFDPTLIRLAGWPALAAEVDTVRRDAGAGFVAADEYGIAAELARELPRNGIVVGAEPRWNLFALPPAGPRIAGRIGILVQSARRATPPDPAPWQSLTQIGVATRGRASNLAETYRLWRVVPREGGADADGVVVLPHPD